eukprot:7380147-Prymnesium_polylepis.1
MESRLCFCREDSLQALQAPANETRRSKLNVPTVVEVEKDRPRDGAEWHRRARERRRGAERPPDGLRPDMCATEPRAGKEPAYAELLDEDLTDTRPASSDDSVDGPSKGVQFSADVQSAGEQRQPIVEATGGSMTAVIVLVLNVTYAGVVFHGPFLGHFMSYGIALNLLSTALSTAWLSNARKQLPYVCVADSFMAVLFAQGGSRILASGLPDDAAAFSTLILAMGLTSVFMGVCYIIMGCAKVCKVVQFVPSPVMAGYQASIGCAALRQHARALHARTPPLLRARATAVARAIECCMLVLRGAAGTFCSTPRARSARRARWLNCSTRTPSARPGPTTASARSSSSHFPWASSSTSCSSARRVRAPPRMPAPSVCVSV